MKFSEKLRLLIDEFDITQKQFANDLNIAPSTIGGYVQGVDYIKPSIRPIFDNISKEIQREVNRL